MRTSFLLSVIFVFLLTASAKAATESQTSTPTPQDVSASSADDFSAATGRADADQPQSPAQVSEIMARVFKREKEEIEIIGSYSPIVETYIQTEKPDLLMGMTPRSDFYFLGQAEFHGNTMRIRSMLSKTHKGTIMWSFNPAGFLQMAFPDYGQFDKEHYQLMDRGRTFLGDVRCYVFDVQPLPNAKHARFVGRIWVEDQQFTIVRMNGEYTPEMRFSPKTWEDQYYEHFDSWRINVKSGDWLPYEIYSQDMRNPPPSGGPRFKAKTHFWGYGISTKALGEEFGRLLVESQNKVKDDSGGHDLSPLQQQRDWRTLSEENVFEVLQRAGLVAPEGDVDKVLNTIVNNILVTNHFDSRIEIKCRVMMTTDLEMFSMQNTIVLSRGLIDSVPNEEALAALLAFEIADAMEPKPAQDQYGFSDILRLKPTQAMRKLSFVDTPDEAEKNSERAVELLKNSPYGSKLGNAGIYLSQLQSQLPALKQLFGARLGNHVHFIAQLIQSAPPLDPASLQQASALPMDSRIKIDPWSDRVSLMKTQQMGPISPREKIPFEVTPISLYLTRYVESSANGEHSIVPRSAMPVVEVASQNGTLRAKN
ncbi:MAG: hypothetical protein WA853_02510 [Candidatus Acidiferrum sp.]